MLGGIDTLYDAGDGIKPGSGDDKTEKGLNGQAYWCACYDEDMEDEGNKIPQLTDTCVSE